MVIKLIVYQNEINMKSFHKNLLNLLLKQEFNVKSIPMVKIPFSYRKSKRMMHTYMI